MITVKSDTNSVFTTTRHPTEPFVQDSKNLLIDFSKSESLQAVKDIHSRGEKFMAEALVCLLLSLQKL